VAGAAASLTNEPVVIAERNKHEKRRPKKDLSEGGAQKSPA
jgi:hypothetical protein